MPTTWEDIAPGFVDAFDVLMRLGLSVVLCGLLGLEREHSGKDAGLRTHMLVGLGVTVYVLVGVRAELTPEGISRVIQGIGTGIGFIGAGTILKRAEKYEVEGLTTAAGIWLSAAISVAVGLGEILLAITATISSVVILALARIFQRRTDNRSTQT